MSKPWHPYKIGEISTTNWVNANAQPITEVYHVAHLETARRILMDHRIRAGLIYDNSRLNKDRILVTWLSPNTWNPGYRYGNVRFTYDFNKSVANKKYYWVEVMHEYTPPALRILITDKDYSGILEPYDPTVGDGPWYFDSTRGHYWNGNYTLEFMFENDFWVSEARIFDFVRHHSRYCCLDASSCKDKDLSRELAKLRFIASIIANDLPVHFAHFQEPNMIPTTANWDLRTCVQEINSIARHIITSPGSIESYSAPAVPVMKAVLNAIAKSNYAEAHELMKLFKDANGFSDTLINIAAAKFHIHNQASLTALRV